MIEAQIAAALSDAQAHTLLHSLGVADEAKRAPSTFYRSHFVTDEASVDHLHCMVLFNLGLMTRRANLEVFGGMDCFNVTGRGEAVARLILAGRKAA